MESIREVIFELNRVVSVDMCDFALIIAGVIDADYRGNVGIVLFNHSEYLGGFCFFLSQWMDKLGNVA